MKLKINLNKRVRELEIQRRRHAILCCRLRYGFLSLFKQPWTFVFPLLLVVLTAFVCCNLDNIPLPGGNTVSVLAELWHLALLPFTVVLSLLAFLGFIAVQGTPKRAKEINAALDHINLCDRYGLAPALLHSQPVRGKNVQALTFYSRGIDKSTWERCEASICDILNVHFVEPPHYGGKDNNNRNLIVIIVSPGAEAKRSEPLYDDEF